MGTPSLQRLLLAIVWEQSDLLHPHSLWDSLREVRDGDRGAAGVRPTSAVGSGQGGKGEATRTRQEGRLGLGRRWEERRVGKTVNFGDSQRWLESWLPCS